MLGWILEDNIHGEKVKLKVLEIKQGQKTPQNYYPLNIETSLGKIECRYFPVLGSRKAVLFVGEVSGNFDSPANNLYSKLAVSFNSDQVSAILIKYRFPGELSNCVLDVLSAVKFLEDEGVEEIALVGHSFGGAVVIQVAALQQHRVKAVAALSTQLHGTEVVSEFQNTPLLLIHGQNDQLLPAHFSEIVYQLAQKPKAIKLLKLSGHWLNEESKSVYEQVYGWITTHLQ